MRQRQHETLLVEDAVALESDALVSVPKGFGTNRTGLVATIMLVTIGSGLMRL